MNTTDFLAEGRNSESGMATAEYAVGTMAASSFAGIILWIIQQDWVKDALENIFKGIFKL